MASSYPYSRYSNPIGQGQLTAAEIDASFAVPVGVHVIHWCDILRLSDGRKINHDLAAGGIYHETGGGTSRIFRDKNNPGGIGAENDNSEGTAYDKAITFATLSDGICAYIAGLITYNDPTPRAEIAALDPRFNIRRNLGYVGIVQHEDGALYEYEQRYARTYPESKYEAMDGHKRYGAMIALRTNQMYERVGKGKDKLIPKPTMNTSYVASYSRNKYNPAEDGARVVEAFVYHIATATKASNLSWLAHPSSGASTNYYIAKDGEIFELVPWEIAAWTHGQMNRPDVSNPLIKKWHDNGWNPNQRAIGIEHEGEAADTLTEAQIKSNNQLTAWLSQQTGVPVDRTHIIGHYQIDSVNRPYCPSFSEAEWSRLIGGAQALLSGSAPVPPAKPEEDANARKFEHVDYGTHWVVNQQTADGFITMYDGWKAGGGLDGWGWPLGGMSRGVDGVYRQPFENCIGEVWPRGFDGKSKLLIRKGGIPQNWMWYRSFVRPLFAKWGIKEDVDPSSTAKG